MMHVVVFVVVLSFSVDAQQSGGLFTPCSGRVVYNSLDGTILGVGSGSASGIGLFNPNVQECTWIIDPNAKLKSITFRTDRAYFDFSDDLSFFSSRGNLVGRFSRLNNMPVLMKLMNSDSATLVLRSTSALTGFNLQYSCEESDEISLFGHSMSPARFVVLVATGAIFICFFFVLTPTYVCWYRRARRAQANAFQQSMVVAHSEHQRQRAVAEEADKRVMTELEAALPMQTFDQTSNAPEDCTLCLESFAANDEIRVLPCNHFYHKECVDKWFAARRFRPRTCPMCRRNPLSKVSTEGSATDPATTDTDVSIEVGGRSGRAPVASMPDPDRRGIPDPGSPDGNSAPASTHGPQLADTSEERPATTSTGPATPRANSHELAEDREQRVDARSSPSTPRQHATGTTAPSAIGRPESEARVDLTFV